MLFAARILATQFAFVNLKFIYLTINAPLVLFLSEPRNKKGLAGQPELIMLISLDAAWYQITAIGLINFAAH